MNKITGNHIWFCFEGFLDGRTRIIWYDGLTKIKIEELK